MIDLTKYLDKKNAKVLVIDHPNIGDTILKTGVFAYIYKKFPNTYFKFLTGEGNAVMYKYFPGKADVVRIKKYKDKRHLFQIYKEAKDVCWDLIITYSKTPIDWVLKKRKTIRLPKENLDYRYRYFASVLGEDAPFLKPVIWTSKKEEKKAEDLLVAAKGSKKIALSPIASHPTKTWPTEYFVELMHRLTDGKDALLPEAKIILLGSPQDVDKLKGFAKNFKKGQVVDLVGKADILTVYEVMRKCDLFVGNDSGVFHLAVAAGVPSAACFGSFNPHTYGYAPKLFPNAHQVIADYMKKYENKFRIGKKKRNMRAISVDQFYNKISDIYK
jgi:ADP-heptose:LPS heptosyltransferase